MDLLRLADRFSGLLSFADVRSKADDFVVDRLSYQFTTAVLCAFAVLCGMKSSYTVPIICWVPAQLRRYERAIMSYCYANNTYYVPENMRVPPTAQERYESLILYYQWLPWIFGVQAALFYLPKIFWFFAVSGSGFNVQSLVGTASKLYGAPEFDRRKSPSKMREEQIVHLNSQLFGQSSRDVSTHGRSRENRFQSCYLLICYLVVKLLYFVNCLVQIGLIHLVIGTRPFFFNRFNHFKAHSLEEHFIGQFVQKISSGVSELIDTSSFPKRTLCDFTFRELASNHAYTVECILPLNIIVEKMYVFLYLWFILLAVIILFDFIRWTIQLIHCLLTTDRTRERYVRTHLIDRTRYNDDEIKRFAQNQLTGNNYFILKLFSKNISTFVVVDMIDYFFRAQLNNQLNKKDN